LSLSTPSATVELCRIEIGTGRLGAGEIHTGRLGSAEVGGVVVRHRAVFLAGALGGEVRGVCWVVG